MPVSFLADENTSHRFVSACRRIIASFPIVYIASWEERVWLGLDDSALLRSCAEANLVLVSFDRASLAWHAGQLGRAGQNHSGLVLFRRSVRNTDYGRQARLVTQLFQSQTNASDWENRIVYLPKSL